jgi:hypothetical protein
MNWMTATRDDDVPLEFFYSVDGLLSVSLLCYYFPVAICRRYHSQLKHGCDSQCAAVPQCSYLETYSFFFTVFACGVEMCIHKTTLT